MNIENPPQHKSSEDLQQELWSALENSFTDPEGDDAKRLEKIKEKYNFVTHEEIQTALGQKTDGRSKNGIEGLTYTKNEEPEKCVFMKAEREGGTFAYAVIAVDTMVKYRADLFSPAYYEGHGSNHDFSANELLGSLYVAITGKEYVSPGK